VRESLLKVSTEKTGPCQYVLNVEVEPEQLQQPLRDAGRRLSKRRPLPGFRPGKAPYNLIERTYGKEVIYDEMLSEFGNELYEKALQESRIEPYDRAGFEVVQMEPLILKITVPTLPETTLGDYSEIRVEQASVTVTEEDIAQVLAQMQQEHALWVPVDRSVQLGDQIVIDAVGTADSGRNIEQKDLTLQITETLMPAEFRHNLLGMKTGESKEFDVEYAQDFYDQDLAGSQVHFRVTVKATKEKELPPLDDELAKSVGSHETLEELRSELRSKLLESKEKEAKDAAIEEALNALVEQATLEYPAISIEREINDMISSLANRLSQDGFTLEGYLNTTGRTLEQLREETRPDAETRLKRSLVLAKFAEAEGIKLGKADIDREVEQMSADFGEQSDTVKAALRQEAVLRTLTTGMYNRKVLDHLLAIATGQIQASSKDDDAASELTEPDSGTADEVDKAEVQ
jgi:trigger factor